MEGAEHLARMLETNTCLQVLDLVGTNIQVACKAILELLALFPNNIYSQEVLTFISEKMNKDNKKACLFLNPGEITELMKCPPDSVMKAKAFLPEMIAILCNNTHINFLSR